MLLKDDENITGFSIILLVVYHESVNLICYVTVDYQLIVYGRIVARVIVYVTLLQTWRATFEPDET